MKTRVTEWYCPRWGVNTYGVEKWALWDDPELRGYYPDKFDWRHVTTVLEKATAIGIAERLSKDPAESSSVVVWESP